MMKKILNPSTIMLKARGFFVRPIVGDLMKPGKLARALLFAAAMIGLTGASPLAEAPKPAQNILTESFEINHLDIIYSAGGGIHFTVIADSYDGQSQSGLPTEQIL